MKAIKDNKVYTVDETSKSEYLARGYDIYSDDGKLIESSASSTVSRKAYDELAARNAELERELTKLRSGQTETKKKGKTGGEG